MLTRYFLTFPIAFFDKKVQTFQPLRTPSRFQVKMTSIQLSPLIALLKLT